MKRVSRLKRGLWIAAGLLLVYTLVGFFVLPPIVKAQLEKRLSAELGRRVTVERVKVNPYALSLTLQNFAIKEADGSAPFVGWRTLYVNFDLVSSLWREWVLSEIALDGLDARVAINADQSFNFSDILAKLAPPGRPPAPETKPGRPIRIAQLRVTGARTDFSDASREPRFASVLGPLTFTLTQFRTVSDVGAPYRFAATTESGEQLAWSGTLQAEPIRSSGEFSVGQLVLAKYAPYYADKFQGDIAEGKLSVRGRYELNLAASQRVLKLSGGAVELRGFKLLERSTKEPVVELPVLDITGVQADALAQKATVEAIRLNGGRIAARREKDGTINLLAIARPPGPKAPAAAAAPSPGAPPPSPGAPAPSAKPPNVNVAEIAIKDLDVAVNDLSPPRPAQLALHQLQLSIRNATLAQGAQMPVQVSFGFGQQGTVRVEGNVGITPIFADLKADVGTLELGPLSPYLEQFAQARLTQGSISASLNAQALMTDEQRLAATVSGEVKVEKFALVDAVKNEELAGFDSLSLQGLRASTSAAVGINVDEVNVVHPYARVIVNQDRTLNLAAIQRPATPAPASPDATPAPAAPPPSPAAPAPKIEIGKVVIRDGDYRFSDRSVEPNVQMAINQFGGTIAGLSSSNPAKATVDLKATVDGAGPVAIAGKLDPLAEKKLVDLKIDARNVDLLPLSPYSAKYAGFELARGKLVLDVKLLVDGSKIDAANVVTLHQLTFGQPVKSPDATGLPVRLGVALLKDTEGKIVIDVPVQGNTDDPSFRVGRVVLRVITNLLTKAAVSPFSLLGSMFGGGGDELAYQEFTAGSSDLMPAETKKLETMVKALTNRPALNVDLDGHFDPAADAYALKRAKLTDLLRRTAWETRRQTEPNLPPPDQLTLAADEEATLIRRLFNEKFPPGTQFGAPVPPPPAPVSPPPPPPGFFKRLINALTLQTQREERAAQEETARRTAEHEKAVAEAAAGIPIDEMRGRLAENLSVDENELRGLAQARAQHVRDYFLNVGKISPDRIFLAQQKPEAANERKGARVFLGLQ